MSTPDFPTGTGPIATPSETSEVTTTSASGPIATVGTSQMDVTGTGPVPTFIPPVFPPGPVVGGVGTMAPGGFV